jgi:flagella basal body P-ring formation protein FlgA
MLRILVVLLALTAPAIAQEALEITGSLGTSSPLLKRSVTVTSDVVRIGDLIENAGSAAQIAIFRAPDIGTSGNVPVSQVLQAARTHAVIGIDTADITEVRVTRASRTVTTQDVEARIAKAVAQKIGLASGDSQMTARLDGDMTTFNIDASATAQMRVTRLTYDTRSGRFDAAVEVPGGNLKRPLRFTGTAFETVEVATLLRPIERGGVVRANDVVMERRPKTEAGTDIADSSERVVGMAARRAMRAGQTLRMSDLSRPELVQRNENVTVIFEVPGIMLTSRAKALEAGAEGDLINVLNPQSKRTIQGVVTGPSTITVTSMKPRIAAATSTNVAALQDSRTE